MIKGVFLGTSMGFFLASVGLMIAGFSGNLQENYVTGAVIGADKVVSYATMVGIASFFLSLVFLFLVLKKKH
jgi:hypothetical protein